MNHFIRDGNVIGRIGAIAALVALGFGLHHINCSAGMCPVMKTDSCCAGAEGQAKATVPKAAPATPTN